jgi:hypothetical protein
VGEKKKKKKERLFGSSFEWILKFFRKSEIKGKLNRLPNKE